MASEVSGFDFGWRRLARYQAPPRMNPVVDIEAWSAVSSVDEERLAGLSCRRVRRVHSGVLPRLEFEFEIVYRLYHTSASEIQGYVEGSRNP